MRIDRLLWFLRFAKSRSRAQKWVAEGHIRRNGERVERLDQKVVIGDFLTLPLVRSILVIELIALPQRRGPAEEARECYHVLDAAGKFAIAPEERLSSEREVEP